MSSGEPVSRSRFMPAITWIEDRWPEILNIIATSVLTIAVIWVELRNEKENWLFTVPGLLVVVFSIVAVFGSIMALRKTPGIQGLQSNIGKLETQLRESSQAYYEYREKTQRDLSEMCRHLLICIAADLKLTVNERISIYKHDASSFLLLARWSENNLFCQPGRTSYPDNVGVISEAWRLGEAYHSALPDPKAKRGETAYYRRQNEMGITVDIVQNLKMKSRSYWGLAIREPRGVEKIAVVIVESTGPSLPNREELRRAVEGQSKLIAQFVEKMTPLTSSAQAMADPRITKGR